MTPSVKIGAVLLSILTTLLPGQTSSTDTKTATCAPQADGYFEGAATSKEAGVLKVILNLACKDGNYEGGLVTPVGRYAVLSGLVRESTLTLAFGADKDEGTLETTITRSYARRT